MKTKKADWMKKWSKELIFTGAVFLAMTLWAFFQPFDSAPDEAMRYQIPAFIFNYGKLPHGGDPLIRSAQWGLSYGFGPQLSYIIEALFMKVMSIISKRDGALIFAARMVSVCCGTGTVWMTILMSKKLFEKKYRMLFVSLIGLLPQFLYLSSYVNNDIMALFGSSIIVYMWICGMESGWKYKHCIGLAAGIVICTLTYYNSYGFILCSIILFFASLSIQKTAPKEIAKRAALITVLVLALTGWYFIRNYIIYDGDILAMNIGSEYAEKFAVDSLKPSMRQTPYSSGQSIVEMFMGKSGWFAVSWRSFVGVFGYMAVYLPNWNYFFYAFIFWISAGSLLLKAWKKKAGIVKHVYREKAAAAKSRLFHIAMAVAAVIPFGLALYYSYFSDYQPQGRYLMPMLIPLMYFVTHGIRIVLEHFIKPEKTEAVIRIITVIMAFIAIYAYLGVLILTYWGSLNHI